ncbi:hypothetical protein FHX82_004469 [Amycolatopsis bartoniae]|uniref:Uncharacterized protein n=1 Tax=Amycolatopsis bartoniae TaxID=941986 RepID=A0A8H9MDE9_9PSEU|nr:hypothetical protein [Amycolatopsis bartoniae]MBB2937396.1 hypothetical protein [Amycolatopsis bartoniae]TVS99526.1 hypothetical protein FNH07_34480 [Amycolatopsis bartoniae]GHF78718.1 hypothetical protein GCM10017566_61290 [Amycolatopsis bartoniae]
MDKVRAALAALLLGVLLSFTAPVVAAAPAAVAVTTQAPASAVLVGQQTPAPGPVIDPADNERANQRKTKNKVVVGVIAAILLVIVVWGRSIRRKRRKKSSDQAKGK